MVKQEEGSCFSKGQLVAQGPPLRSGDAYCRGREREELLRRHGTGLDPLLTHLQGFSSSLKPRPPRRRTGGERELTHRATAPERNLQGPPITSEAASSKSKANQAGKASPQKPSGKPSRRPRRALPSNRSRGAEILRGRMETGAGPSPLAAPSAKPFPCQRRVGPKPHVSKPVAAGPNPSTADEAPALACKGSVPGASKGCSTGTATASRSDRPRSAPRASPAAASRTGGHLVNGSPRLGRAKPNPRSANRACQIRKHPRAALRHARGRGRKSPSASRHRWECQEAGSLLRHPLPARSRPSTPPPRRKSG